MPATIRTAPIPDYPGLLGYEIVGTTSDDVQAEIMSIMDVIGGVAEFTNPRFYPAAGVYRSIGYAEIAPQQRRPATAAPLPPPPSSKRQKQRDPRLLQRERSISEAFEVSIKVGDFR